MEECILKLPNPAVFTQIKLFVVELAATVFFVAFVIAYLVKELRGLF